MAHLHPDVRALIEPHEVYVWCPHCMTGTHLSLILWLIARHYQEFCCPLCLEETGAQIGLWCQREEKSS
jgi:hypothetical protein